MSRVARFAAMLAVALVVAVPASAVAKTTPAGEWPPLGSAAIVDGSVAAIAAAEAPTLSVDAHVQDLGWLEGLGQADLIGTTGDARRLEALRLRVVVGDGPLSEAIEYRAHVENIGWQEWQGDGDVAGTTDLGLKVEAVRIRLTPALSDRYDLWYQVHVEGIGWMAPTKNGASAGTTGLNLRVEALRAWLVERDGDDSAPPADAEPAGGPASENADGLSLRAHVGSLGWLAPVGEKAVAGTTGRGLALEALAVSVDNLEEAGSISYRAHVSRLGWLDWVGGGAVAGTVGNTLPVEAVEMKLEGGLEDAYDLYYRAHVSELGWLGWARDAETAGSTGLALPVEAVQAVLVPKGGDAPDDGGSAITAASVASPALGVSAYVRSTGWGGDVASGGIAGTTGKALPIEGVRAMVSGVLGGAVAYRSHVSDYGWVDWVENGEETAHVGEGHAVEAVQLRLTGAVGTLYDVWYRVHASGYGWLGWARNGEVAGSTGAALPVEAIEVRLVRKGGAAPGSGAYHELAGGYVSGDLELDTLLWTLIRERFGTGATGLRNAYDYVRSLTYRTMNTYPAGTWTDWSVPYAKEMYRSGGGNCYRYASLMTWLARALGYDAVAISGNAGTRSGGLTAHSWCEVHLNGGTYIIDCSFGSAVGAPQYDWCLTTYAAAHASYYTLGGARIG